jgi:hypothetical protein
VDEKQGRGQRERVLIHRRGSDGGVNPQLVPEGFAAPGGDPATPGLLLISFNEPPRRTARQAPNQLVQ